MSTLIAWRCRVVALTPKHKSATYASRANASSHYVHTCASVSVARLSLCALARARLASAPGEHLDVAHARLEASTTVAWALGPLAIVAPLAVHRASAWCQSIVFWVVISFCLLFCRPDHTFVERLNFGSRSGTFRSNRIHFFSKFTTLSFVRNILALSQNLVSYETKIRPKGNVWRESFRGK